MRTVDLDVQLRLSQAQSPEDAIEAWIDHADELAGYSFVLSNPTRGGRLRWSAKENWGRHGFLRSIFAHSYLWFTNENLLNGIFGEDGKQVKIPVDYSIGFDVNAASHLRAFVEGGSSPILVDVETALRSLATHKFNWDLMPYFAERAAHFAAGTTKDRDGIWRAIVASERFAASDMAHFSATGKLRPLVSEEEIGARVQFQLALWDQMQKSSVGETYRDQHQSIYWMVLKIALLERQWPGRKLAAKKLAHFLRFMDEEVSAMWLNVIWAAGTYFDNGPRFSPFAKLTLPKEKLCEGASNVAWDLFHATVRRQFAAPIGREKSFYVPYFLTFDAPLAALLDGFPQRSCLLHADWQFPQFFADIDVQSWLMNTWPELRTNLAFVFSRESHHRRVDFLKNRKRRDIGLRSCDLEKQLLEVA